MFNEDHFSSLVLMRTKSSIEDLYGSTAREKMLESRPEGALVKLVLTVLTVLTVVTVFTVLTVLRD